MTDLTPTRADQVDSDASTAALTPQQISKFKQDGFLIVRNMLPRAALQPLIGELEQKVDNAIHEAVRQGQLDAADTYAAAPFANRLAFAADACKDKRWLWQTFFSRGKPISPGMFALRTTTQLLDATEALIGALYSALGNFDAIHRWLSPHWHSTTQAVLATPNKFNGKTALQEWSQSQGLGLPTYRTDERSKAHGDPERFNCRVSIQERELAEAKGRSRKEAEQNAAAAALQALEGSDAPQASQ